MPFLTPYECGPHVIVVIEFLDAMKNTLEHSHLSLFKLKKEKEKEKVWVSNQ